MKATDANSRRCRRSLRLPKLAACAAGLGACLTPLLATRPAQAQEFRFNVEPAAAFFVAEPQWSRFNPGFHFAVRPGITIGPLVSLQLSYELMVMSAKQDGIDDGSAHFLMAGVRVRPLATLQPETEQLGGLFVDANAGYVRTGTLDRFGFNAGVGYAF